jgi:uncharacterized protein (DUF433 family)
MVDTSLIVSREDVLGGTPCLRGTRIPVALVLEKLGAGETVADILASYGYLTEEQLHAAIEYGKTRAAGDD